MSLKTPPMRKRACYYSHLSLQVNTLLFMRFKSWLTKILVSSMCASFLFIPTKSFAIHGGESALGDDRVVALFISPVQHCSGALIEPRIVFTVAHCLSRMNSVSTGEPIVSGEIKSPLPKLRVGLPGANTNGAQVQALAQFADERYVDSSYTPGKSHGSFYDFAVLVLEKPIGNKYFKYATADEIRELRNTKSPAVELGYGYQSHKEYLRNRLPGEPARINVTLRAEPTIEKTMIEWQNPYYEEMMVHTLYLSGQYGCGGDSGGPLYFKKNNEWVYVGAGSTGAGPECSAAPESSLWTDEFWSVNSGGGFFTAQAFQHLIDQARTYLAQQEKIEKAASDRARQEVEASAAAKTAQNTAVGKKITIICIKGKTIKKVTGLKPACPKGYKKKP